MVLGWLGPSGAAGRYVQWVSPWVLCSSRSRSCGTRSVSGRGACAVHKSTSSRPTIELREHGPIDEEQSGRDRRGLIVVVWPSIIHSVVHKMGSNATAMPHDLVVLVGNPNIRHQLNG